MIQRCRRPRLLLESLQPFGIGREGRWQDLDRDVAVQLRITRAIDLPMPPAADGGPSHASARRTQAWPRARQTVVESMYMVMYI